MNGRGLAGLNHPSVPYIVPFAAFVFFLALEGHFGLSPEVEYPVRVALLAALLWFFSRDVISFRTSSPAGSLLLGVAVFALWIGPDVLIPGYRQHWLFNNSIVGSPPVPGGGYGQVSGIALAFRVIRAVAIVPILEELFWRAWLMRWLIRPEFLEVPLGTYAPQAFLITALLFGAEHGTFWGVGVLTGLLYNWWMVRTKSLGDCILCHAVTNACLCAYVVATGKWEYW